MKKIAENYKLPYYTISPTYSVCKNHGYIAGEVKVCPECGSECEIYSRITGYYRPVKNWNDGKTQEFKERKTYNVAQDTVETEPSIWDDIHDTEEGEHKASDNEEVPILVVAKTCPKCKEAERVLLDQDIGFVKMMAEPENKEFVDKHGIKIAPTLVVGDKKYEGIAGVMKYIYEKKGWAKKVKVKRIGNNYECPSCNLTFSGWDMYMRGDANHCPYCRVELEI